MTAPAPFEEVNPALTWTDFLALPDDDRRELVDGKLMELEMPTWLHEHIVGRLVFFLTLWALDRGATVLPSGYKVRIHARKAFIPDVQLYLKDNPHRGQEQGLAEGRPDLVVEVISPTSRRHDRLTKVEGYARIGVPEYWIVDAEARSIERLVLRDGLYTLAGGAMEAELFQPAAFEGLQIPLDKLWSTD